MKPLVIQSVVFFLFFIGLIVALRVAARRERAAETERKTYTKRPSESYNNPPKSEAKP